MLSQMKKIFVLIWVSSLVLLSAAAAGADTKQVVASFYPLAYAAEQIGGSSVSVDDLTPAGAEPHDLELKASDVVAIQKAEYVFYLGNGFQPGVEDAVWQILQAILLKTFRGAVTTVPERARRGLPEVFASML